MKFTLQEIGGTLKSIHKVLTPLNNILQRKKTVLLTQLKAILHLNTTKQKQTQKKQAMISLQGMADKG